MSKQTNKTPPVAGHTPGPWRAFYSGGHHVIAGTRAVCATPGDLPADKENAAFIVVACNAHADLLAALERALEAYRNPGKDYDWTTEAEAAIAKAKP